MSYILHIASSLSFSLSHSLSCCWSFFATLFFLWWIEANSNITFNTFCTNTQYTITMNVRNQIFINKSQVHHTHTHNLCLWRNYWIFPACSNFNSWSASQYKKTFKWLSSSSLTCNKYHFFFYYSFDCNHCFYFLLNSKRKSIIFFAWNSIVKAYTSSYSNKPSISWSFPDLLFFWFDIPILCASDSIPLHIIAYCASANLKLVSCKLHGRKVIRHQTERIGILYRITGIIYSESFFLFFIFCHKSK